MSLEKDTEFIRMATLQDSHETVMDIWLKYSIVKDVLNKWISLCSSTPSGNGNVLGSNRGREVKSASNMHLRSLPYIKKMVTKV